MVSSEVLKGRIEGVSYPEGEVRRHWCFKSKTPNRTRKKEARKMPESRNHSMDHGDAMMGGSHENFRSTPSREHWNISSSMAIYISMKL